MSHVLLLNPPGDRLFARDKYCTSVSKSRYYWPQIDLLMLSGWLHKSHQVTVLDAIIENLNPAETKQKILREKIDAVIFLTCSASWDQDFKFIKEIKEARPQIKTIASGGFLLFKGKAVLQQFDFIDAILLNFSSSDILDYLAGKAPAANFIWRQNNEIVETKRSFQQNFKIPLPRHELFPLNKYIFPLGRYSPYTVVMASLGCPAKCSFCLPATLGYWLRDLDNTIEELQYIASLNIREILFQDSTFTAHREHTITLCERMLSENLKFSWICLSRVDCVDRELLTLMKRAGCHSIQFGIESGDESMLKNMLKGITKEQCLEAFQLCKEIGIQTAGFFIIGMPGETEASVRKTIQFAKELDCDVAAFSLPMPHPGTRFGEAVRKNGWVLTEEDLFNDIDTIPASNLQMPLEKVWQLRNEAYRKFYLRPRYILKRITSIKTTYELKVHLKAFLTILKRIISGEYSNKVN